MSETEFGKILKETRIKKSLTLEEASTSTKININTLRFIEESSVENLPKKIFTRGLIKSYSSYLEIPADPILEAFDKIALEEKENVSTSVLTGPSNNDPKFVLDTFKRTVAPLSILVIIVLLVGITYSFLKSYRALELNTTKITAPLTKVEPNISATNTASEEGTTPEVLQATEEKALPVVEEKASAPLFSYILVVEPLAETYLLIKADEDDKPVRARLKPNKVRKFRFNKAEVVFADAGAINILVNGKDKGVPGKFGEVLTMKFPEK